MLMDLKVRKVPKEVFTVMNLNDHFNHLWVPDTILSVIGLGTSYFVEFFEYYGDKIGDYYDKYIVNTPYEDSRFKDFISQEKRHAAAHKQLNKFMAKDYLPPTKEKYHPRIYDFMYAPYKEMVEPVISGIIRDEEKGTTVDSPYFKQGIKDVAVFETEICLGGFLFYDKVVDNGRLEQMLELSENLGVLYLLCYHYAEEMEHCTVSIDAYEKIFNETLWTPESTKNYVENAETLPKKFIIPTLFTARMLNIDITVKQIQSRLLNYKDLVNDGLNVKTPERQERAAYLIDKWDNVWEPMVLDRIHDILDKQKESV